MQTNYQQLQNETSTDRAPGDGISPLSDASDNPFEKNPDDSVDITAHFDDQKARTIESNLKPKITPSPFEDPQPTTPGTDHPETNDLKTEAEAFAIEEPNATNPF